MAPRLYCRNGDLVQGGQRATGGPGAAMPAGPGSRAGPGAAPAPFSPWVREGARGGGQAGCGGRGGRARGRRKTPAATRVPPRRLAPARRSTRPSRHPPLPWKPAAAAGGAAGAGRRQGPEGTSPGMGLGALRAGAVGPRS